MGEWDVDSGSDHDFPARGAVADVGRVDIDVTPPSLTALAPFGILLFTGVGPHEASEGDRQSTDVDGGEWKGPKCGRSACTVSNLGWDFAAASSIEVPTSFRHWPGPRRASWPEHSMPELQSFSDSDEHDYEQGEYRRSGI